MLRAPFYCGHGILFRRLITPRVGAILGQER